MKHSEETMRRRDFLVAGSACLLGSGLPIVGRLGRPRLSAGETTESEAALTPIPAANIAYWMGSEDFPNLEPSPPPADARLVPAASLAEGDPAFAERSAQVTIEGVLPGAVSRNGATRDSLSVNIDYRPYQPAEVCVWSVEFSPLVNASGAGSLLVPIHPRHGLRLLFEQGRARRKSLARFTLGRDGQTPRLRRGVYVVDAARSGDVPRVVIAVDYAPDHEIRTDRDLTQDRR